jgi:hypothetical protein
VAVAYENGVLMGLSMGPVVRAGFDIGMLPFGIVVDTGKLSFSFDTTVTMGVGWRPNPFEKELEKLDSSTITISWNAVAGAAEYYVYMRVKYTNETSADPNSLIMSYITTSTNMVFRHSGFINFFAVKAGNSTGISGFSNVVSN